MDENKTQIECGKPTEVEAWKAILHLSYSNRRMLIALITVCITFIITIAVFVSGYTAREKNWLDTLTNLRTPATTEVADGVQQKDHP